MLISIARILRTRGAAAMFCTLILAAGDVRSQEADAGITLGGTRSSAMIKELESEASAIPPKSDDPHELSIFYHKRGMANQRLGRYKQAAEDLRAALKHNQPNRLTPQGWGERWRIQNDLGNTLDNAGDGFAAIEYWKETAREYQSGNPFLYHISKLILSSSLSTLGYFADAESALKEANEIVPRLRASSSWSRAQYDVLQVNSSFNAIAMSRHGNHVEAERLRRIQLDASERDLDRRNRQFRPGDQSIRIGVTNLTGARITLAEQLATRNKFGEAEVHARAGLAERLAYMDFNSAGVSYALAVLGWTKVQQGDLDTAQKYYGHALSSALGSGIPAHSTLLADRRARLANVLVMQQRWQDAIRIFNDRAAGLRSDAEQLKRYGPDHVSWALALARSGQAAAAAQMSERLVAAVLRRPVPNRYELSQRRGVLGMALAAQGQNARALEAFREAIPELIRRDQDDSGAEQSGNWRAFWRRMILEAYLDLLVTLHADSAAPAGVDIADEAFRIADIARGSSVQEAISASASRAQLPDAALAELARKDQDALSRTVALNQVLSRLANSSEAERLNKVIADIRAEIERLRTEHVTLSAEIRKRFPEYAELIDPRPPGLAEVGRALSPGEAMVSIYVGETRSYVWTLGAGGARSLRLVSVGRSEIDAAVARLRAAVDFGEGRIDQLRPFDLASAHKLYQLLFAPDEALWKGASTLNVITHGALGQLPLSLLVTEPVAVQPGAGPQVAYRGVPWLIRKVALAHLPSASAFVALRRAPASKPGRQPFVGFGDPMFTADAGAATRRGVIRNLTLAVAFDPMQQVLNSAAQGANVQRRSAETGPQASAFGMLSALPDTADELKEIAAMLNASAERDVFTGPRASEQNVKRAILDNRRVVAFATHGISPGELAGLDQPALALSNPALSGDTGEDGFLTMEEVLGLKLDADWVVLSACNTASADGRGSEAVSGLGRAFFYAGARSLLVSNWAVETTSARLLTTELFRYQAETPTMTRAQALRQSMLALMDKSAAGPVSFSYAHPAFWAPFSLVGDSGAR